MIQYTDELKEEIRSANDIVDVVNECTRSITITREVENG